MTRRCGSLLKWLLLALAAAGWMSPARGAARFDAQTIYLIRSASAGKALQVRGADTRDLANIEQYGAYGGPHQCWRIEPDPFSEAVSIFSLKSGKVLDVVGYSSEAGANIQQFRYFGTRNQQWLLEAAPEGGFRIISQLSGKCVGVAGDSPRDGANILQTRCRPDPALLWRFTPYPHSRTVYRIVSEASGKVMEVQEGERQDGANVRQFARGEGGHQLWSICPWPDDRGRTTYVIAAFHSGRVLDVKASAMTDGANVQQHDYNGGDNQRWLLRPGLGKPSEIVAVHSGKCLDVKAESTENAANIQQHACNGGANQRWRIEPAREL